MPGSLATRFLHLFAGLPRAYGIYRSGTEADERGKFKGKGDTIRGEVTAKLWQQHLAGAARLGIIPVTDNATASFGAIDIDVYDNLDLPALEAQVQRFELPLTLCRSKSGGAHLYLFAGEPLPARLVRDKLTEWATVLGYPGVEIFPKQVKLASTTDVGNWINMPYFDAELSTTYALHHGQAMTAEAFLQLAESRRVDADSLKAVQIALPSIPEGSPPCLQALATNGVPEGSRNNALFAFAVLARLDHTDDGDENAWQEDVVRYNEELFHPPLSMREVGSVMKSASGKNYFYPCNNPPLSSLCNKSACRKQRLGVGNGDGPDDPGVMIDGVTKILTDPPTWIFRIDGVNIEMDTDDFLMQSRFRRCVVEKLNRLPKTMKQGKWDEYIGAVLQNAEEETAPEDASSLGQFFTHLFDFCMRQSRGITEESLLTNGLYHDEEAGIVYFRSTYFEKYLQQQKFYDFSKKQIYAAFRKVPGMSHGQKLIKGRNVQFWCVPEPEKTEEGYTVPRIPEEEF